MGWGGGRVWWRVCVTARHRPAASGPGSGPLDPVDYLLSVRRSGPRGSRGFGHTLLCFAFCFVLFCFGLLVGSE